MLEPTEDNSFTLLYVEYLLEYLLSINLSIYNKGNKPTFLNRVREQVIDMML